VMVEAMACGTPVLALKGGSVPEVVRDGVSGYLCRSTKDMVKRVRNVQFSPTSVRRYVEENFALPRMVARYISLYRDVTKKQAIASLA